MTDTVRATAYLTIEPEWAGDRLRGVRIAKVTLTKPRGGSYSIGSAVVRLTISLPRRVFVPFEASAEVEAGEGDVGVVRVVVEPFGVAEKAVEGS